MQHDFANIAAQTDIPSRCRKKIRDEELKQIKIKELQRKRSPSLKTITKNEDQIMDRKNGLEAKITREENRTTIMMDL